MKSVTEFFSFKLVKGNTTKAALAAEGKTPEEIEQSLGEAFKLEGDKLKFFINSMQVAEQNAEKLGRVLVYKMDEGERLPQKAVMIDDHCYVPEFEKPAQAPVTTKPVKNAGPKKDKRKDGPKSSPWGISPEEAAAKKAAGKKAQAEKG